MTLKDTMALIRGRLWSLEIELLDWLRSIPL